MLSVRRIPSRSTESQRATWQKYAWKNGIPKKSTARRARIDFKLILHPKANAKEGEEERLRQRKENKNGFPPLHRHNIYSTTSGRAALTKLRHHSFPYDFDLDTCECVYNWVSRAALSYSPIQYMFIYYSLVCENIHCVRIVTPLYGSRVYCVSRLNVPDCYLVVADRWN